MASSENLFAEEQVHCSICLDFFTNPVSIPCGHNFCIHCIRGYWKTSPLYQCPMCKKTFIKQPDTSINTVLREIAQQFKEIRLHREQEQQLVEQDREKKREEQLELERKQLEQQKQEKTQLEQDRKQLEQLEQMEQLVQDKKQMVLEQERKQPEQLEIQQIEIQQQIKEQPEKTQEPPPSSNPCDEVSCDICTGERLKAAKSCLVCLTSYCEEHLRSHSTRFTKHKLIEPVANLEDRMCKRHERLLELYCKKDHVCVCVLCTETDHRAHYTVPVEREWTEKKVHLFKLATEVQQMIQERLKKVKEIKHSVELNKTSAQREIEDSMKVFSDLLRAIQKTQAELVLAIEEKQRETENLAQRLIVELEKEIGELQSRNSDLEHLSRTDDHIDFLQSFPSLCTTPHAKDWSEISVHTEVCVGTIRRAVCKLEENLNKEIDKLTDTEVKRIQKYTADITLDPKTANPWLQLSQDKRQVRHLGVWQELPDNPERFDTVVIVMGKEGFNSGRHYWEVQVGEKDDWYLGVARASVNRKGRIAVSTAHGYWALAMKKGEYRASTSPSWLLTLDPKPKCIGVYLDYEEGQVSFYNSTSKTHIYTFMDTFQDGLYPFFYLYCCDKASETMAICPVNENATVKQC